MVCFGRFWVRGLPFPNARHLGHPFQWKNTLPWHLARLSQNQAYFLRDRPVNIGSEALWLIDERIGGKGAVPQLRPHVERPGVCCLAVMHLAGLPNGDQRVAAVGSNTGPKTIRSMVASGYGLMTSSFIYEQRPLKANRRAGGVKKSPPNLRKSG